MEIILLGTGGAWPDADRSAPAFLVTENDEHYLIDCGGGVNHQLMRVGHHPKNIDTIFLTHLHIDHCVEFPSLVFGSYLTGKEGEYQVYGPKGTSHFTESIFDDTYNFAKDMMLRLRKKEIKINSQEVQEGKIFEKNGLSVFTTSVKHGIPSLAYKFVSNSKSVVFSGDTAPCENIIEISKNVDLLVIECSFPEEFGPKPGHLIPSQISEIAKKANVGKVVLVHLFPPCKGKEKDIIDKIKENYSKEVLIGNDLDKFEL